MRKHHSAAGGAALALALTLMGCSDDGTGSSAEDTSSATPTKTPTSTSPTPTPTPTTAVEKATGQLVEYLNVRDQAYRQRKIDFKKLNRVSTGDAFLQLQSQVAGLRNGNVTVSGQYVHALDGPRERGNSILITDCEDRADVVHKVDGAIRSPDFTDPNGNPLRNPAPVAYTLVKDEGVWKVTDSDLKWDQPC